MERLGGPVADVQTSYASGVVIGDFNGDGRPDVALIVGSYLPPMLSNYGGSYARILWGVGDGSLTKDTGRSPVATITETDTLVYVLAAGDMNGDGVGDLIVQREGKHQVCVYLSSQGTFSRKDPACASATGAVYGLAVADFDGDGLLDVVAASSTSNDVTLLRGTGTATLQPPLVFPAGKGPESPLAADLDGDGFPDLVVANVHASVVTVLRNGGCKP